MNIEEKVNGIMDQLVKQEMSDIIGGTDICTIRNLVQAIIVGVTDEFESRQPKQMILKIKRTEDAKQFPLLYAKKDGDVGFDLTAIMPYSRFLQTPNARKRFVNRVTEEHGEMFTSEELEIMMRETITLIPHHKATVPTGIFLEIPKGYWASIEGRSSTSKQLVVVPKGVIDEGYRGELFAVLINVGTEPIEIKHGDRYVQLIMHKRGNIDVCVEEVNELSESERGDTGFGSTGQSAIVIGGLPLPKPYEPLQACCKLFDIENPNNIDDID